MKLHHRRLALVAVGIAGTGVLVTGVASAATSSPTSDGVAGISAASLTSDGGSSGTDTARGKLAQALKQIRTDLKAGQVSGEVTVDTKKGPQSIEFQRGTVSASTASTFTVTDTSDGAQVWTVGPKMKVRDRAQRKAAGSGASATSATVSNGENVIVVGLKTDTAETARLVVVVPAKAAHAPKSGKPSGGPTTSTNPATSALQS